MYVLSPELKHMGPLTHCLYIFLTPCNFCLSLSFSLLLCHFIIYIYAGVKSGTRARGSFTPSLPALPRLPSQRLRGRLHRVRRDQQPAHHTRPLQELPGPRVEPVRGQVGAARRAEVRRPADNHPPGGRGEPTRPGPRPAAGGEGQPHHPLVGQDVLGEAQVSLIVPLLHGFEVYLVLHGCLILRF